MITKSKYLSKKDELFLNADLLVPTAIEMADELFYDLINEFPVLNTMNEKNWKHHFVIAAVVTAQIYLMFAEHGEKNKNAASLIYGEQLIKFSDSWESAFSDCNKFVITGLEESKASGNLKNIVLGVSDAIGQWILSNLLMRNLQTEEEINTANELGEIVTNEFAVWWD